MTTRRDFLVGSGLAALALKLRPREVAQAKMRLGYAAITWGDDFLRAIDEIAEVGYQGIQLRANVLPRFQQRPAELKDLLGRKGLTFVALSSGNLNLDPAREEAQIAEHVSRARFLRDAGGLYLQIIDERPAGRPAVADDYRRMGQLLTKLGERTADLGIPVAYHPHMGALGEKPDEVERVLEATDPKLVKLLLDVAHYQQGGGDPAAAIRRHRDRLAMLHLKDVETRRDGGRDSYRFVELGKGRVDLPGVLTALRDIGFGGWGIVELDAVPDGARSAKESAVMSKRYLESLSS